MQEEFLHKKLDERKELDAFRKLRMTQGQVDFCSNDYLGISKNNLLDDPDLTSQSLNHGSTGSRLLSGNYPLIEEVETEIARFHQAESSLIFNSGYDANVGLLGCVAQQNDTIFYDYLSHASIRDGIRLTLAKSLPFRHNDVADLEKKLQQATGNVFVVTESVFSMGGDLAPLLELIHCCEKQDAHLVVDEAHATGVIGEKGQGLVQHLGLQEHCFARVHTFGKALGVHGAAVVGSQTLREYLINFSRPFIYTTALPEISVAAIQRAYRLVPHLENERKQLGVLIQHFQNKIQNSVGEKFQILKSQTTIQGVIIPGNGPVKKMAQLMQENQLDVRPILYPTVPKAQERLRILLHAFNTPEEIERLATLLA